VDLAWCGVEGTLALAGALKVNTSVADINFAYNAIGAEGASALADALKVNMSVTTIQLSGNEIGADVVSAQDQSPEQWHR
jgi:hypothetical protein